MPEYDFRCAACDRLIVLRQPITAALSEQIPCECGGIAERQYSGDVMVLVPGAPIDFAKPAAVPGWERGMTKERAEREYSKLVRGNRTRTVQQRRSKSRHKPDVRLVGQVPEALFQARMNQFGKDYWTSEGKKALRRDDLLF